jgi:hypothetical protein
LQFNNIPHPGALFQVFSRKCYVSNEESLINKKKGEYPKTKNKKADSGGRISGPAPAISVPAACPLLYLFAIIPLNISPYMENFSKSGQIQAKNLPPQNLKKIGARHSFLR